MKKITLSVLPLCLVGILASGCKNQGTPESMDRETDAVFSYLAKRRGMNVLRVGGSQLGTFGSVYTLLEPSTNSKLYQMARNGVPIDISPYDSTSIELPTFTVETTSYQIQSQFASEIGGQLKGQIESQGGSVEAFKKKLVDSNVRFKVSRISTYEKRTRDSFSKHTYRAQELPENSNAILAPLEILVVTDFSFERKSDESVEGKLVANFLDNFQTDIKTKSSSKTDGRVGVEEARVIAIRPLVLAHNQR
jgi:hypothetical protein